ncbi:MAG TPA: 30S ribosomal protein S6 [Acidimicrobiales bacterium]|nr:30S ribosomal protein S6 [Acidimicrobiales bacterium]
MRPYEAMIIFDPDAEESAVTAVLDRGVEVVKANGGNPGAVNRWGKRALAYEIRKKREGYYVVVEYTADPRATAELERMLTLADEVIRHKIIRLPDKVARRAGAGSTPVAEAS